MGRRSITTVCLIMSQCPWHTEVHTLWVRGVLLQFVYYESVPVAYRGAHTVGPRSITTVCLILSQCPWL